MVYDLGLGVAYQKTMFRTKIGTARGYGSIQRILGPILISATVEASNFKFGIQLRYGE